MAFLALAHLRFASFRFAKTGRRGGIGVKRLREVILVVDKSLKPYSTQDIAVASHPLYPRTAVVFHETPVKYPSGRIKHSYTHRPKALSAIRQGETVKHRRLVYARQCALTFQRIPEFTVFSASQYAKAYGISHVTAKKRLKQLAADVSSDIVQVSPKLFVKCSQPAFVISVVQAYNSDQSSSVKKGKISLGAILKALQKLRDWSLKPEALAYYGEVAKVTRQQILSWLIRHGFVHRLTLDFLFSRASVVYFF